MVVFLHWCLVHATLFGKVLKQSVHVHYRNRHKMRGKGEQERLTDDEIVKIVYCYNISAVFKSTFWVIKKNNAIVVN